MSLTLISMDFFDTCNRMTKREGSPVSFIKTTGRLRRHSIDELSPRKVRGGRFLTTRKSKLRYFSVPDDDMYYSEPDMGGPSGSDIPMASIKTPPALEVVRSASLLTELNLEPRPTSSEDDTLLFETGQSIPLDLPRSLSMESYIWSEIDAPIDSGDKTALPLSYLRDYMRLPFVVEYVVIHGIFSCLSSLLYEMTLMPLSALRGLWKRYLSTNRSEMSFVEKSDLLRTLILITAVVIMNASIDFSAVYHYIRAQSLLKLYFIFNMMEIIERLVRSWGNDLVDGMIRCMVVRSGFFSILSLAGHWLVVLVYTLIHTYIHFWRVMIISVAILANDMLIVLVTNNFNELKGTVFKKIDAKALYPVITSDVVERLYLFVDVSIVLFRMATSPQRTKMPFGEVSLWIAVMIALEIFTDWMKFLCISKFNRIDNATYWQFSRIHKDDILNSRNSVKSPVPPLALKGFTSASHLPSRRMNFMPTPIAVLILCNVMLPNLVGADALSLWSFRLLVISALFLAKFTIDWLLIGDALRSDRSGSLPEKLINVRSL